MLKSKYADHHAEAERLTSEINAVTEQRDEWANLWAELSRSCVKDYVKLERELISITEQRDRLAEAMTRIVNIYENPEKGCIPSSSDMYDEALQSLTTNASLSHGDGSATPLHEKS
jgi:predicted  nucleic acid-binding Zn-ribbon protein